MPACLTGLSNFGKFLYNPQKKTLLDRNFKSWGTICLCYLLFLLVLLSLFALSLFLLLWVVHMDPYKGASLLTAPGMGFVPLVSLSSPIIWTDPDHGYNEYIDKIKEFLEPYVLHRDCSPDCSFQLDSLDYCGKHPYGYDDKHRFCVFLKINKVRQWTPDCYNNTLELPEDMPTNLREYIQNLHPKHHLNYLWVHCSGLNPVDKEKMGDVQYFPQPGFEAIYFPLQDKHKTPLVAISFLEIKKNILVTVKCVPYAKNMNRMGTPMTFQLYVGDKG